MRTYERTHSWLTFKADLTKAPASFWMSLGEAQSKCEHIAGVPLRPSTIRELKRIYLAKGVLATTAIEGNTLTEEEIHELLDGELELPPSKEYLAKEVKNIIDICNDYSGYFLGGTGDLQIDDLIDFNERVLHDLPSKEGAVPGKIRTHSVGVGRYRGAPAEDCEYLLDRLCQWLNGEDFKATQEHEIAYGLIKAVLAHLYLAWIHPFGDGNGRTARLVEFHILLFSGVPEPSANLLSNHYNRTRNEYYQQLDKASKSGGNFLPFLEYAISGFLEELKSQLGVIRDQQWDVSWRNYIHEMFRDKKSEADVRRRHLVLDLSSQSGFISISKIREISPRVSASFATKKRRTISRDINELVSMDLIEHTKEGVRAKKEKILAFLPDRRIPEVNVENE